MEFWLIAVLVLAIVMFFAPLIIIFQLSDIKHLLRKICNHMDNNHNDLMDTNFISRKQTETEQKKIKDDRARELMKSLFQDEENTPD